MDDLRTVIAQMSSVRPQPVADPEMKRATRLPADTFHGLASMADCAEVSERIQGFLPALDRLLNANDRGEIEDRLCTR